MPHRRPSPEHQEAVSRRLALLSAELAAVRPPPIEGEDWTADHTRIRPAPDRGGPDGVARPDREPVPVPEVSEPVPAVPVPGRHAARRAGRVLVDAVPGTLRGRVALGPAQLTVVAVLVALGLAVTAWWVVRGDADRIEAPTLEPASAGLVSQQPLVDASPVGAGAAPSTGAAASPDVGADAGTVVVDVAGKVRRPGIAVLDAGSRVVDALDAAGGARRGVDLSGLNLARVLVDGEQILVGEPEPTGLAAAAQQPVPGSPGGPLVNLNTATQAELEALPEVGPVTAQAIMAWREEHGGFTAVDELLEVDGIGDATLQQLAPHVTV